jgi:hypothetical protein
MTERTGPDWDPRDPSVLTDQRRAYDEMRARCPVAHSDFLGWSLFTHRDVVEAVRDTVTFSSATKRRARRLHVLVHVGVPQGEWHVQLEHADRELQVPRLRLRNCLLIRTG